MSHHGHHHHHMHGMYGGTHRLGYLMAAGAGAASRSRRGYKGAKFSAGKTEQVETELGRELRDALKDANAELHQDTGIKLEPINFAGRTSNELRPSTFDGMVGQARLKMLLKQIVGNARATDTTLDHLLLVGSAGTGKTTLAQVVGAEMGRNVYQIKCPVELRVLEALGKSAHDGDVVILEEIHLMVHGDRRGITQAADVETAYSLLEDKRLETPTGPIPFPDVTFIGTTTDAGLLPEPFLARFPLQPPLEEYTVPEMETLACANAEQLKLGISPGAALIFANACRGTPRVTNRYLRNARSLGCEGVYVDIPLARQIVEDLNATTLDGLDKRMCDALRYLLRSKREDRAGSVVYQASINNIATACGCARDTKIIQLAVEPWLIRMGLVQVTHGGRQLTDAGIQRAKELSNGR